MSQIPNLQCLFCQHSNPAGAEYCQNCDGQLNLQPCPHCDAVDLRTATHCYKCGASFPVHAAPGHLPVAATGFGGNLTPSATPVSQPVEAGMAQAGTRLTYAQAARLPVHEVLPSDHAASGPTRRGPPLAVLTILGLLMAAAAAAYVYRSQLPQFAQALGLKPPAFELSRHAPALDAPANAFDSETVQALPPVVETSVGTPAPSSAPAEAAVPAGPAVASQRLAPQEAPAPAGCPAAVAALGLCNPDKQ